MGTTLVTSNFVLMVGDDIDSTPFCNLTTFIPLLPAWSWGLSYEKQLLMPKGRKIVSPLTLFGSQLGLWNKDRLTKVYKCVWCKLYVMRKPSWGSEDPKKSLSLSVFTLHLIKSRESWGKNMTGKKGYELRIVSWGSFTQPVLQIPVRVPLSSEIRMFLSSK